jgi:hypothetical protein
MLQHLGIIPMKLRKIFQENIDKLNWNILSKNPNALYLLEQNMDKINWSQLSENPNALYLLEQNIDKIDWYWLPFQFQGLFIFLSIKSLNIFVCCCLI